VSCCPFVFENRGYKTFLTGRFVSALHIPPTDPSCLISGGGDPVVKVWDWLSGRLRWEVSVWECVEPFVGVERVGRKSGEGESEGEGGEGEGENGRKKRGRKQDKKGKSKAKSKGKERQQAKIEMKSAFHWEIHLNPRRCWLYNRLKAYLVFFWHP